MMTTLKLCLDHHLPDSDASAQDVILARVVTVMQMALVPCYLASGIFFLLLTNQGFLGMILFILAFIYSLVLVIGKYYMHSVRRFLTHARSHTCTHYTLTPR